MRQRIGHRLEILGRVVGFEKMEREFVSSPLSLCLVEWVLLESGGQLCYADCERTALPNVRYGQRYLRKMVVEYCSKDESKKRNGE